MVTTPFRIAAVLAAIALFLSPELLAQSSTAGPARRARTARSGSRVILRTVAQEPTPPLANDVAPGAEPSDLAIPHEAEPLPRASQDDTSPGQESPAEESLGDDVPGSDDLLRSDDALGSDDVLADDELWYESQGNAMELVPGESSAAPTSCSTSCYDCYVPSGWVQAEYLMWWPRPMNIPPLVTRGTTANQAILGRSGTETLLDGDMLNQMFSGVRLRMGLWADSCHTNAWQVEGFLIGEETDRYTTGGTGALGSHVIGRPFFNILTSGNAVNGQEDAEFVSYPGELSGTVTVEASSQLLGVSVHRLHTFAQSCGCAPAIFGCGSCASTTRVAGFIGWRYLDLDEELRVSENLTSLLDTPDDGQFLVQDRFATGNLFNGAELGMTWSGCQGPYSLHLLARLALGSVHQTVSIAGSTSVRGSSIAANNFENATGGLLAQRTNIGDYSRNEFAVVPELGLTAGYALSDHWRATVGYTFLYWSSVVRPGDQIDRDVNPNLIPPEGTSFTGLERPVFAFVESDLWINGLNIGLERTW